ncbi:hypothetical protein FOA52_007318 [Chlamydomonas sp. UWO 241]|nr:hypothetical protein FOA52_007318 [Chlamydomonas sp. UWO 241]
MVDAKGYRFNCRRPLRVPEAGSMHGGGAMHGGGPMQGGDLPVHGNGMASTGGAPDGDSLDPVLLLDGLATLCFYRQEGLWTYEVCYKKHARQSRQRLERMVGSQPKEAASAEDFMCGKWDPEGQDFSTQFDASTTGIPMAYIAHNLTAGGHCSLSGAPRTSQANADIVAFTETGHSG